MHKQEYAVRWAPRSELNARRIDKAPPLEIELQERAKEFVAEGGEVYQEV
jgi:hypothetical protein